MNVYDSSGSLYNGSIKSIKSKKSIFWIDGSNDSDIGKFQSTFNLHPVMIEDIKEDSGRPKLDVYPNCLFISAVGFQKNKKIELNIVLGKNFIATFSNVSVDIVADLKTRKDRIKELLKKDPSKLMYFFLDNLVDSFYPLIEALDDKMDEIEKDILESKEDRSLQHLYTLRSRVFSLRKLASQQRDLLIHLTKESNFVSQDTAAYLRDAHDQMIYVLEEIEYMQQLMANILSIHMSMVSNKMNEVMKVLTVIATIVLPLTFISSVYGMNFKNMPELFWPNGYYYVLGFMGFIAFMMLLFFRRKKWL